VEEQDRGMDFFAHLWYNLRAKEKGPTAFG
jgi:hypothetical protein